MLNMLNSEHLRLAFRYFQFKYDNLSTYEAKLLISPCQDSNYNPSDVVNSTLRLIYWKSISESLSLKSSWLRKLEDPFYFQVILAGLLLCDRVDDEVALKYFSGILQNIDPNR